MSDYGSLIADAMPGVLADTSDHNIDGSCVVANGAGLLLAGKVVWAKYIMDGGYLEVTDKFGSDPAHVPYGVALRSQYCNITDAHGMSAAMEFEPVSVVTHGRVWALTMNMDVPPDPRADVRIDKNGFISIMGDDVAGWSFTGNWMKWDGRYWIVELQIRQSQAHLEPGTGVKVNGAVITIDEQKQPPYYYSEPVNFSVEVSPANATNKRGTWHLDDWRKGHLQENEDGSRVILTNPNSYLGDVHVIWVANDGSGVQAMKEITFVV